MSVIEKLFEVSKQLPDQMQNEVLDFAEYLVQKISKREVKSINLGKKIHERFKAFCLDELVVPERTTFRNPPEFNL